MIFLPCSFDRNYILVDDLEFFMPRVKAQKAFEMLDVDCDGQVSLHDIRDAVLNIYRVSHQLRMVFAYHLQPVYQLM